MPRFRHKVIAECFYGDVFRDQDKHNVVVTNKPFTTNPEEIAKPQAEREFEPLPSAMVPMDYDFDDDGNPAVEGFEGGDEEPEIDATEDAVSLALEFGIDLNTVEGTGKDGRIVKADVQKAAGE